MTVEIKPYNLALKHPFTLGNGSSRTHTAISIIKLKFQGKVAFGEAAMPPYLGENHETVAKFINQVDFSQFSYPFNFQEIHHYLDAIEAGNSAAKAAIDIALHNLWSQVEGKSLPTLLKTEGLTMPITAGTIGISSLEEIPLKIAEITSAGFRKIKIKLGGSHDQETVKCIRACTNLPFTVDVNQGWTDEGFAAEMSHWLAEQGVALLEQPFPKNDLEKLGRLKEKSPIPVFADESCQRLADVEKVAPFVDGVNIKLMKSTGIWEAIEMVKKAKSLGLLTMLGCMTETSCASYAALAIAPLFDYVDIDGPWMLKEQPFQQPIIQDGRIVVSGLIEKS